MVGRVLEHKTAAQVDKLHDTLQRMERQAQQGNTFPEEDREFHQRMFENINNRTLLKLIDIFWQTYNRAARNDEIEDYDPMKTYLDHVAIVKAFEAGDAAALKTALEGHYTGLGSLSFRLDRVVRGQTPSPDGEEAE
jgi:DNA-binding FadR family transcriptional regulator